MSFDTAGKPLERVWFEHVLAIETRSNEIESASLPAVSKVDMSHSIGGIFDTSVSDLLSF